MFPALGQKLKRFSSLSLAVLLVLVLCGCYMGPRFRHSDRTSSIVDYLYPGAPNPLAPTSLPVLRLPLRVGVAFVPSGSSKRGDPIYFGGQAASEMQKAELLRRVVQAFGGRDYIASIETVPSSYLRPGGGFDNLDQVQRLLNVDVIALVSYDQVQFTDQNRLSLSYWTIVGAYFIHGNKNDTQTLMEAAVYDITSRQLLFRAAGAAQVTASSTLLEVNEKLRSDSGSGLQRATDDLIANLKTQLDGFRERLKAAPDTVAKIERRPGYTGAGATGPWFAVAVVAAMICGSVRAKKGTV